MKRCSKCGQEKELGEFAKQKQHKDGLTYYCKACKRKIANDEYAADSEKYRKRSRDWKKRNPEMVLKTARKHRAGRNRFKVALEASLGAARRHKHKPCSATPKELEAAFTGRCNICGTPELECSTKLAMDHDHETGAFRGWLCRRCNRALGLFGDSTDILIDALHFLMAHQHQE